MEKEFVPYEPALALKELGFDEPCLAYYLLPEIERTGDTILHYCSRGKEIIRNNNWSWVYENFPSFRKYLKAEHCYTYSTNSSRLMASAPTYSQAFRWFREKHKLGAIVSRFGWGIENEFGQIIHNISDGENPLCYEEAELECLKKLIQLVN